MPAHFKQAQQCATHTAAQQAGIAQVQLLQEPVAAALAYGINGGTDGDTVLVFDVGGGTFDIRSAQGGPGLGACHRAAPAGWCAGRRWRPVALTLPAGAPSSTLPPPVL